MTAIAQLFGKVAAGVVRGAARFDGARARVLSEFEQRVLRSVFDQSLDLGRIEVRDGVRGLVNISGRVFVIENTVFVPPRAVPLALRTLVHEACHVWQFQHGGYAYISNSLYAQTLGDGYDLEKGLSEGRPWSQLNVEQQATFVEYAWHLGCFEGRRFVLNGRDWSTRWAEALAELRAGEGAPR